MVTYKKVDVSERQLEDLVRRHAAMIEEGSVFVDHQRQTNGGRLDVLMADEEKALIVAELKVVEDDGMLLQGLDYYDYVTRHIEALASLQGLLDRPEASGSLVSYRASFSQTLMNRCKWLNVEVRLFTFACLKFDGQDEIVPVFVEQNIPTPPPILDAYTIQGHLDYITDDTVQSEISALLDEIKNWKPENITFNAVAIGVSIRVNNRVFAYVMPRRTNYWIGVHNSENTWIERQIKAPEDLAAVKILIREKWKGSLDNCPRIRNFGDFTFRLPPAPSCARSRHRSFPLSRLSAARFSPSSARSRRSVRDNFDWHDLRGLGKIL